MLRLATILYSVIATTMAGSFFIAALVTGNDRLVPIIVAVALGVVMAIPISYLVAQAIINNKP